MYGTGVAMFCAYYLNDIDEELKTVLNWKFLMGETLAIVFFANCDLKIVMWMCFLWIYFENGHVLDKNAFYLKMFFN